MLILAMPAAFLQLAFLPGFLALVLTGLHRMNPARVLILSAALSGVFNMLAVYAMWLLGCFTPAACRIIFLFEMEILLCAAWYDGWFSAKGKDGKKIFARLEEWFSSVPLRKVAVTLFLAACAVLAYSLFLTVNGFSEVFRNWDSVLSWNRWAVEWTSGGFPTNTRGYPQLAPCGWAFAYQICGQPLEFLAHAHCLYFEFLAVLAVFDLAFSLKKPGLFAGAAILAFYISNLNLSESGGEADLCILFYSFLAVYGIFLVRLDGRMLYAVLLAAVGAGAAKQSGLAVVLLFPAALCAFAPESRKFRAWIFYALAAVMVCAPYYIVFSGRLAKGAEHTNVTHMINDIYSGRTVPERGLAAAKLYLCEFQIGLSHDVSSPRWAKFNRTKSFLPMAVEYFGRYLPCALLLAGLILLCLWRIRKFPVWRGLIYFWCVPYTVVWLFTFCYDLRNLGPVIGISACGMGLALYDLLNEARMRKILAVSALLFAGGFVYASPDEVFLSRRNELARGIGTPVINELLCSIPFQGAVATDYEFLSHIPDFHNPVRYFEYSNPDSAWLKIHAEMVRDPSVGALLVPDYIEKPYRDELNRLVRNGVFQFVFNAKGYSLLLRAPSK